MGRKSLMCPCSVLSASRISPLTNFTISRVHTVSAKTVGRCTSRFRSLRESPRRFAVWRPAVMCSCPKISCLIWSHVLKSATNISNLRFKTTSSRIPSYASVPVPTAKQFCGATTQVRKRQLVRLAKRVFAFDVATTIMLQPTVSPSRSG